MLRVLIVEDVERDAELLVHELGRGGFQVSHQRVDTPEAMTAALEQQTWDLVLADYVMPRFGAAPALKLLQDRKLDLPFIVVSGTVNEETAVAIIRAGAHDFMAKGNLARLIPAVERELREAGVRAATSQMGKGSVFRTVLPVAKDVAAPAPAPAATPRPGRRGAVLVVDDEPALGAAVRRILAEHDVLAVSSAGDALRLLGEGRRFDVILCDLMMPEITGMELHSRLSRELPGEAAKVVFMTGGAFTTHAQEFLDKVGNPSIEKPFDLAGLKSLIRRLVG